MKQIPMKSLLVVALLAFAVPALAATRQIYNGTSTVSDAPGNVLLSDGYGSYSGGDTTYIINKEPWPDHYKLVGSPATGGRFLRLQMGTVNVNCAKFTEIRIEVLEGSDVDFFNMPIGTSKYASATLTCDVDNSTSYKVSWGNCVSVARVDASWWGFTSAAGCTARLDQIVSRKAVTVGIHDAPFKIDFVKN